MTLSTLSAYSVSFIDMLWTVAAIEPNSQAMKTEPKMVMHAEKMYYFNWTGAISFPTRRMMP